MADKSPSERILPTGEIGMDDVNIELSDPATDRISLNDSDVRTLAGRSSGSISLKNLQGKASQISLTLPGGTHNNIVVRDHLVAAGWVPGIPAHVTVPSNAIYLSTSISSPALNFNASDVPAGSTLTVSSGAKVYGRGGTGGKGGNYPSGGDAGGNGGDAIHHYKNVHVTIHGSVAGGGGGGGGGGGKVYSYKRGTANLGGGGGGGGASYGVGGGGGIYNGHSGGSGSLTGAGGGGTPASYGAQKAGYGGSGGGLGAKGANGQSIGSKAGGAGGNPGAATKVFV